MRRQASCSCGALTIEADGEPVRISVCHCTACQRRTGSPFGQQARYPRSALTIRGDSTCYTRRGDSGEPVHMHFCPRCGSTVYYLLGVLPDMVGIPVGAFADSAFPPPRVSVYSELKHPWVVLPDGCVVDD